MVNNELIDLQIKITHLEKTSDELNAVIIAQDRRIQDLESQLRLLYKYLHSQAMGDGIEPFDLLADRPPHY